MNAIELCPAPETQQVDWLAVVNYLTARARRSGVFFDAGELQSLAGLAAARAKAYWDPDRATCSLKQWAYSQGWRLMLSAIRDELRSRKRSVRHVAFADLADDARGERHVEPADCDGWSMSLLVVLDGLSASDRTLVMLRVERWTFRQIGRRFGLSGEAIRLRLGRLADRLGDEAGRYV